MQCPTYDVRDAKGLFLTQFWKPVDTPIFDAEGLLAQLHQVADITEAIQKKMTQAFGSLIQRNDCFDTSRYPFVRRRMSRVRGTQRHQREEHSEEITAPEIQGKSDATRDDGSPPGSQYKPVGRKSQYPGWQGSWLPPAEAGRRRLAGAGGEHPRIALVARQPRGTLREARKDGFKTVYVGPNGSTVI